MAGTGAKTKDTTHVEVSSIAARNAYPAGKRLWGMAATVTGGLTYRLLYGLNSTNKSDNLNWVSEALYMAAIGVGGGSSAGAINAIQKSNGAGGFVDSGLTSQTAGLSIERLSAQLRHVTKILASNLGLSGSQPVVSAAELVDGESVTIKVTWSAKDVGLNSGGGGSFVSSWTKQGGVLAKIFDNDTIKGSNSPNGTITISSSQSAGTISVNFSVPGSSNNMAFAWGAELIFTKI